MAARHQTPTASQVKTGLLIHVVVFLLINGGLVSLNVINNPDNLWCIWVLIGWGAGLVLHAFLAVKRLKSAPPVNWQPPTPSTRA